MTHYETLDIPTDAPPEVVKRAYRKKASKAHPDREGGSAEKMKAVNKAYEVLIDPQRRGEYDKTGNDLRVETIDELATKLVAEFFAKALGVDAPNLLIAVHNAIEQHKEQHKAQRGIAKARRKKLEARRDAVSVKLGPNVVHQLIDAATLELDGMVEAADKALQINAAAKAILTAYESNEPAEFIMPSRAWNYSTTGV